MNHYFSLKPDEKSVQQVEDTKYILQGLTPQKTIRNKTQRRVIVELGRMTNPHDIKKLYEDGKKEEIAEQLKNGILFNINNHYELE